MNYLVSKIVTFLTEQEVISSESDVQDFYRYGIETVSYTHLTLPTIA